MRAVNLMPGEGGGGGRRHSSSDGSSNAAYLLLGVLGVLVVFAALWTVTNKQIDSRSDKLATVNAEADAAEKRAQAAAPYMEFAELARNREATVRSLSATRFDWAHGLREVARVVPDDVWLTAIKGTSGAAEGAPGPTTSAAPAPRFEMTGCTKSQAKVARLMARMRAVDGVRSVELTTSAKPDTVGNEECPANRPSDPFFTVVISFAVPGAPDATVDSTGQVATSAPAAAAPVTPTTSPKG